MNPNFEGSEEPNASVVAFYNGAAIELVTQKFKGRVLACKQHLHHPTFDWFDVEH
jgi:hypothetical protein